MSIHNPPSPITEEMTLALGKALERAASGQRDPVAGAKAIEDMKRSLEETRQKIGTVNVAVDLIRETRNS